MPQINIKTSEVLETTTLKGTFFLKVYNNILDQHVLFIKDIFIKTPDVVVEISHGNSISVC